jgi:hypothetical protein
MRGTTTPGKAWHSLWTRPSTAGCSGDLCPMQMRRSAVEYPRPDLRPLPARLNRTFSSVATGPPDIAVVHFWRRPGRNRLVRFRVLNRKKRMQKSVRYR